MLLMSLIIKCPVLETPDRLPSGDTQTSSSLPPVMGSEVVGEDVRTDVNSRKMLLSDLGFDNFCCRFLPPDLTKSHLTWSCWSFITRSFDVDEVDVCRLESLELRVPLLLMATFPLD